MAKPLLLVTNMLIKELKDEDFINYKKPSMFIAFPLCNFKCEVECGEHCCQNSVLAQSPNINISIDCLIERYMNNPITKAVVCGGLEPFDSWDELKNFIMLFRYWCPDDIVIYTGYNEDEIQDKLKWLEVYNPIIVKVGRYIPHQNSHYDEVLGVKLASENQYGIRLGENMSENKIKIIKNPDGEYVREVQKKLKDNNGFCPCRLVKNDDTKCMCKEFRDAVQRGETGECHCGLFVAVKE